MPSSLVGTSARSRWLLNVVTMGAAALITSACGSPPDAQGSPPDSAGASADSGVALPVHGAIAWRGDLVLTIRTTGQVRAERHVGVRVEAAGTVAEVAVRPGQRVEAGQVLARLDPRPFDLAVREAEGAVADAQVRFDDLMLGNNPNDTGEIARRRTENARLRAGIIGAEARLERARLDRERAVIRAPFGGVVDRVNVVAGQSAGVGDPVATIVDLNGLLVEAAVLEHDLLLMRPGATARVAPSGAADRALTGAVVAVLPVVDTATHAGRVLVRVPSGSLRPGMYADVELEATRLTNRLLVPADAVIERDGRPLVFRAREGRAEWVYVGLGRSNGRETEIMGEEGAVLPPIEPGDTVLVGGHVSLTHDAPIRVILTEQRQPRRP
ncbi:MAG TPA: efflux RND transporter periplasmic adaptor subunit [Gemmatimonadales bacterium]|nr:efflux RND transporter periplasmic adaptor subunit [Gemmatimonadales bacterium]